MSLYNEVARGYFGFIPFVRTSVRPSVRPSRIPCPLCSAYRSGWIHFLFIHLIKLLQKVCCVLSFCKNSKFQFLAIFIPSAMKLGGYIGFTLSVRLSSRSFGLENLVYSVASTVPDGFFPYLVQMITSMRRCVACGDLWPWPIFSRSLVLDLENHVRSVASTDLDGFF